MPNSEDSKDPVTSLQHHDEEDAELRETPVPCDDSSSSSSPGCIRAFSSELDAASDAEEQQKGAAAPNTDMDKAEEHCASAAEDHLTHFNRRTAEESSLEDGDSGGPPNKPAESDFDLQGTADSSLSHSQTSGPQISTVVASMGTGKTTKHSSCSHQWTRGVLSLQKPLKRVVTLVALHAARHPKLYCSVIVVLSFTLVSTGLFTNFFIENRDIQLWTPRGSLPEQHYQWIEEVWNGKGDDDRRRRRLEHVYEPRQHAWVEEQIVNQKQSRRLQTEAEKAESKGFVFLLVHADGANVVTKEGMTKNFEALDRARSTTGYKEHCAQSGQLPCPSFVSNIVCFIFGIPIGRDATRVCDIAGVSGFWFHNTASFENFANTDQDVRAAMSIDIFPGDDENFDLNDYVGYPEYLTANGTELLVAGRSYLTVMAVPRPGVTLESAMVDELLQLRGEWGDADPDHGYHVEVVGGYSFEDETTRAIYEDLPLTLFVAILMSGFTAIVFFKHDWLHSRTLLGVGAVICVTMSLMSGYGFLFILGVPFTNLTLALLFIVFGIGLDDSFIVYSAYVRTDLSKGAVERIQDTMNDVSVSIFMTTATTEVAFLVGCFSTIPAIRWLCIYAFTTILIDFIYQITFFIALIVLDENRIKNQRKDCLICCKVSNTNEEVEEVVDQDEVESEMTRGLEPPAAEAEGCEVLPETVDTLHVSGRIMSWYADKLLVPRVKAIVIVLFTILFGVCVWSATKLELDFDFRSVLPADSFIIDFYDAANAYTTRQGPSVYIYFRSVDQSAPEVQRQMQVYVDAIVSIDAIDNPPFQWWLKDYQDYMQTHPELDALPFSEKLQSFLAFSSYNYNSDMLFDANQRLVASRTLVHMNNVDSTQLKTGIDALKDQREKSREQAVNQNGGDWAFFTFAPIYLQYEFLRITPEELAQSTVVAVISVSVMSMVFMPHWSGILFVAPMVMILYADLLGFIQFFGININGPSYLTLLMAIGLLVDYVMHVVLRYYESPETVSRDAKVKDVLRTQGAAVMLGGLSTFLGIVPLMFASSDIILVFVITFAGLVLLGLSHGLVLLPVLLSILGPRGQPTLSVIEHEWIDGQEERLEI